MGENLIFDGPLLREAETVLKGRPEQALATSTTSTTASPAAFGTAPGGAAAAGRLNAWLAVLSADVATVTTEVANLAVGAGEAARMAEELDPRTQQIAAQGGPAAASAIADGNAAIAGPLAAPAPELGGSR